VRPQSSEMGLSGGALAGAVLGGVLGGLLLLVTLLWCLWVRGTKASSTRSMQGKVVAITGANSGIGKAAARLLSERGATVVLLCRDRDRGEQAARDIKGDTKQDVLVHQCDLSSLASVRSCCEQLHNSLPKIDVLINNAGVCCDKKLTEDGLEIQFATNHLGHFLLTNLLMPLLKKAHPDARIINVSSEAYKYHHMQWEDLMFQETPYSKFKAYAQSKLANILFTAELARKGEGTGVSAYAVHPGVVATGIQGSLGSCGRLVLGCMQGLMKSPETGAQTILHCALEESLQGRSGGYYMGCREVQPHAKAQSMEDAARLWKISEDLTKLHDV